MLGGYMICHCCYRVEYDRGRLDLNLKLRRRLTCTAPKLYGIHASSPREVIPSSSEKLSER